MYLLVRTAKKGKKFAMGWNQAGKSFVDWSHFMCFFLSGYFFIPMRLFIKPPSEWT